jgi:deazaflavin-dependent oxidoreductase (nitroreductase family)
MSPTTPSAETTAPTRSVDVRLATPAPRYLPPEGRGDRVANAVVAWLARRGISVLGAPELRVRGRRSGEVRTTVVNLLEVDGHRYLVAPRGTTQWVRNLRAAGGGELAVGRRVERFAAAEVADDDKATVLRAYLRRWSWEVGRFFEGLTADATDAEVAAAAPGFPVFEVLAPATARP